MLLRAPYVKADGSPNSDWYSLSGLRVTASSGPKALVQVADHRREELLIQVAVTHDLAAGHHAAIGGHDAGVGFDKVSEPFERAACDFFITVTAASSSSMCSSCWRSARDGCPSECHRASDGRVDHSTISHGHHERRHPSLPDYR
jgi:hypothetical protein